MSKKPSAIVIGVPDSIHEAGCYNCTWAYDKDAACGPQAVLQEAKRHVEETGHEAWKHSIRMFHIQPEEA